MAVAGLLAAVLLAVVVFQPETTGLDAPAGSPAGQASRAAAPLPPDSTLLNAPPSANPLERLPLVDLDAIIKLNPFSTAGRGGLTPPVLDRTAELAMLTAGGPPQVDHSLEIREMAVQAIIHGSERPLVLIDGQMAQLNDTVKGNWRIVEVLPTSVMVERIAD